MDVKTRGLCTNVNDLVGKKFEINEEFVGLNSSCPIFFFFFFIVPWGSRVQFLGLRFWHE